MRKLEDIIRKLASESIELSKRMEMFLVEAVEEAGGYVDTNDENLDTIWAFVFDEIDETFLEKQVLAVRVNNHSLLIKVDYPLSTEEDQWYAVSGGMVLINATLYNLCESLPCYLEKDGN